MFEEIAENARKLIDKYCPDWTDYNTHDPGITFLELFAWLKELQQFHLDQIGPRQKLKFLKLLGRQPQTKKPATAYVRIHDVAGDLSLPRGTCLKAGEIPFETEDREFLTKGKIIDGFSQCGDQRVGFGNQLSAAEGKMHFYLFGSRPAAGDSFYIGLDTPFPVGETLSLYITISDDYPVRRNPWTDGFVPLAELKWECCAAGGWKEIEVEKDQTCGFIQNGRICLRLKEEMALAGPQSGGLPGEGYWLRTSITACYYEVAPVMTGIRLNMIPVRQRKTLSQYRDFRWEEGRARAGGRREFFWDTELALWGRAEMYLEEKNGQGLAVWQKTERFTKEIREDKAWFTLQPPESIRAGGKVRLICFDEEFALERELGEGDGFPYQTLEARTADLLADDFEIMGQGEGGFFADWIKVQDFDSSAPEHRHYILDENSGEITFGNCEQGLAPEGKLVIIRCAVCLGSEGNVKEGKINAFARPELRAGVTNDLVAQGGKDGESIDEAFIPLRREMRRVERAVTYEDYENLVRSTPGLMISNCRTIPVSRIPKPDGSMDENAVSIVVQPFSQDEVQKLNAAYLENIRRQLEYRHLIGTKVNVLSPEYVGIQLFAEILVKPYYRDAEEIIRQALVHFFENESWEFGRPVHYSTIYGIIDTLDCVVGVQSLVIDAQGKGITRSINGDVMLPPNGMAYLKEAEYVISAGE
jgi:hypothetical protein